MSNTNVKNVPIKPINRMNNIPIGKNIPTNIIDPNSNLNNTQNR